MKETNFNTEVVNSIKALGYWAYKIPDMPVSMMMNTRFSTEKAVDIVACVKGQFTAIEGKMLKGYQAFGLRHFREAQIETLDAVLNNGGRSYAFLNIRVTRSATTKTMNRLIAFEWSEWGERIKCGESIKKKELETLPYITGKKNLFDLDEVL